MDQKTSWYPRDDNVLQSGTDIDRLYESRNEGGGLANIEHNVDSSIRRLEDYFKKSKEETTLTTVISTNQLGNRKEGKLLYGYFKQ